MALMVSQILDVTRIEEGRMSFELRPASLSQLLQTTLQTYYPVFAKNNNTLEIARGGGSPVALCDPQRVSQVLVNLISNAARHTHNGKITIGLKETGSFAEVSVSDTGEGIPPERRAELFGRYKTAGKSKDARAGRETGTGLGLYICKHIVEEHGGKITLESETGKGTTVRFTLPLQS
jgi:signal transduction histidine kinase